MIVSTSLPYKDTKPQGAPDFYFCINATFRFIRQRLGEAALRQYWRDLGINYHKPVMQLWKDGGLGAVTRYWRDFFAAEPGSEIEICESSGETVLYVKRCPAIAHLRAAHREIDPDFCQHCFFVTEEIASPAGFTVRVEGGNGACIQRFFVPTTASKPQELKDIRSCL